MTEEQIEGVYDIAMGYMQATGIFPIPEETILKLGNLVILFGSINMPCAAMIIQDDKIVDGFCHSYSVMWNGIRLKDYEFFKEKD